jgi:TonB-linked SusC/RagA family outer membrane protein
LDEVVVVGYGTQKKINLTGSVASISGEQITKRPVTSSVGMLEGVLPGLRVVQNNGQPGGQFTMQVHGYGTFSGAGVNPMVLIDGVEGDLNWVDPATIQSVSVLKDASSAAIYGSRAANGVILVTTKDGSSPDGKFKVAYHYNYGIHSPTRLPDMVTNSADYMTAWNTRIRNSNYGVDMPARQYPQEEIEKYRNATDRVQYPNFDWIDFIVNLAPTQIHNLSVSGGKQTRYNFSLGYFDEEGTMAAFWSKRYNGQLNIVSDVSKRLKIGGNISLAKFIVGEEASGQGNYFLCVFAQPPTIMPTLPDGSGRYSWRAYPFEECNWNPYLMWKERPATTDNYEVKAQAWADFEIFDGFHWYLKGATNYRTSQYTQFIGTSFYSQIYRYPHGNGYQHPDVGIKGLTKRDNHTLYKNLYSYLDYSKRFGVHQVGVMAGYSSEENNYNEMGAIRRDYSSSLTPELNAGAPDGQINSGTSNAWAIQSVFGRLNYSFRDKYLFEANMRYDGTSRLSPESRWGMFPSFSAAWRISEERFMESAKSWLSNLKVRGSWGQLGNQNIGLYPYQAMLSFSGVYPFDNATLSQGVAQTGLNNYNIKWETTTTTGLGLDIILYNRLSLTLDVYRKLTEDILRGAQVNALVGLSAPTINNGSVQNTGYDLDIKYQNRVQSGLLEGLTYDIGANFSGFKNKLVKFGTWEDGGSVMREEGRPWNTFYLLEVEGIFQSAEEVANAPKQYGENTQPGMLRYRDTNGDNKIDNTDRVPMKDGVFPDCMYGFTLNGSWKGFDLYGFFQGVAGSKVYVTGWGIQPFVQGSAPTKDQFKNAWTPENHSTKYVMLGDPVSYKYSSTYFLKDNSYFRLKTLQFGYSLPKNIIGKVGLSRLRVYFAGDNLLTFTRYEGLDPERGGNGNFVNYPQNRVVSFGCNIEF